MIFTKEEIKSILITHYGGEEEYENMIEEANELETKISNYLLKNVKYMLNKKKDDIKNFILDELDKEAKGYGVFY
jgi:hypothetical protein